VTCVDGYHTYRQHKGTWTQAVLCVHVWLSGRQPSLHLHTTRHGTHCLNPVALPAVSCQQQRCHVVVELFFTNAGLQEACSVLIGVCCCLFIAAACRIVKLVRAIRKGWLKVGKQREKRQEPSMYLLWGDDDQVGSHAVACCHMLVTCCACHERPCKICSVLFSTDQ
jgi:hypothetical protein